MEVLQYQLGIAVIIFIACRISTKIGLIAAIFCSLFSLAMIFTSSLMVLQFFTIWLSFYLFRKKPKRETKQNNSSYSNNFKKYAGKFDRSGKFDGKSLKEIEKIKKEDRKKANNKTWNNILSIIKVVIALAALYIGFLFILSLI